MAGRILKGKFGVKRQLIYNYTFINHQHLDPFFPFYCLVSTVE